LWTSGVGGRGVWEGGGDQGDQGGKKRWPSSRSLSLSSLPPLWREDTLSAATAPGLLAACLQECDARLQRALDKSSTTIQQLLSAS
jgi:hypothetical protein